MIAQFRSYIRSLENVCIMSILKKIFKIAKKELSNDLLLNLPEIPNDHLSLSLSNYKSFDSELSPTKRYTHRMNVFGVQSFMTVTAVHATANKKSISVKPNAIRGSFFLNEKLAATAILVFERFNDLSARNLFDESIKTIPGNGLFAEITHLRVSLDKESILSLGPMFQVLLIACRNLNIGNILVQSPESISDQLQDLLGFKEIESLGLVELMVLDVELALSQASLWGGRMDSAEDSQFMLYPYFIDHIEQIDYMENCVKHLGFGPT